MNTLRLRQELPAARHMEETQARWSPEERRMRAALGRTRTQELFNMISHSVDESEIWAVGSIGPDDLTRLVG